MNQSDITIPIHNKTNVHWTWLETSSWVPLKIMTSTLQNQKDELDKQISPHKLILTSLICVEHLLLGKQSRYMIFYSTNFCTKFSPSPYKASTTWSIILDVEVQDGTLLQLLLLLRSHSLPLILLQLNTQMSLKLIYKFYPKP